MGISGLTQVISRNRSAGGWFFLPFLGMSTSGSSIPPSGLSGFEGSSSALRVSETSDTTEEGLLREPKSQFSTGSWIQVPDPGRGVPAPRSLGPDRTLPCSTAHRAAAGAMAVDFDPDGYLLKPVGLGRTAPTLIVACAPNFGGWDQFNLTIFVDDTLHVAAIFGNTWTGLIFSSSSAPARMMSGSVRMKYSALRLRRTPSASMPMAESSRTAA